MKKLLSLFATLLFSMSVNAQEEKMQDSLMHHEFKMEEGKMMMIKDNKWIMMEKDRTMTNGSIITPRGMIKTKDGKILQMTEGDWMNLNGEMGNKTEIKEGKKEQ